MAGRSWLAYLSSAWFDISFKWRVASREPSCSHNHCVIVSDADCNAVARRATHCCCIGGGGGDTYHRQHMTAWRARRILLSAVSGYKWRSAASATVSLAGAGTQSDRSRHWIRLVGANRHAINKNGDKSDINFLSAYIETAPLRRRGAW